MRLFRPAARAAAALSLALAVALGGCMQMPGGPGSPYGTGQLKAHHERAQGREVCDLQASGGLELRMPELHATFCGDQFSGKAESASGLQNEEQALAAWEKLSEQQRQAVLDYVKAALPLLGPAVCIGLVAFGVPVPPSVCAAAVAAGQAQASAARGLVPLRARDF